LQHRWESTGGSSTEPTARSLASVLDEPHAHTGVYDAAGGARASTEGAQHAESAVAVAGFICGPMGADGRLGVRDPWRDPIGGDRPLPNGDRSELARDLAEGQGMLGDTRILIVDDSTLYREYLAGVIAGHGVVNPSVAWDLPSLITAIENMMPRVVLLNMATRDGAMLLRQALKMHPSARVIVLGMAEDDESEIVACAEAGVAGYHLRTETLGDLLVLVQKVAAGESLCSPRVSAILLRRLSTLASQRQPAADKELVLTAREGQILKMLELGLSNRDIADQLCIAIHTVKNHVHSLLTKLGVSTRAQAAALSRTIRYTEAESRN
jgi:DNA-binding NarL/FixJ family response regulator